MTPKTALRVVDLSQTAPTRFDLRPDAATMTALAQELDLSGLRKLRFEGEITAQGKRDWRLRAHLGATVTQPCVVTLEPVTTRIETDIARLYLARYEDPDGEEAEMPEDDTVEPVPDTLDLEALMAESLALALPDYPRKDGAHLGEAIYSAPGIDPMRDEDARPFAGLAGLRDALKNDDDPA